MIRKYVEDILVALSLLTRLPIKVPRHAFDRAHLAVWAYGIPGFIWALSVWSIAILCQAGGLPLGIATALGLTTGIIITGAIHEDGLADSVDGLWGGWDPESRLEVMLDSRLGAYGAIALISCILVRWQLITSVFQLNVTFTALVLAGCLGRSVLPVIMAMFAPARKKGLSYSVGRPSGPNIYIAFVTMTLFAFISLGAKGLILCILAATTALMCALIAKLKVGGQSGDILGAIAIITEIIVLVGTTMIFE